jgi:tetratricopeptide (TPR) repeat protein
MVSRRAFYLTCLLALIFAETAWTQAVTQADEILQRRIAEIRQKIDTAASWHATDDQLGVLWVRLGNDYRDERDIARSEEAYARSLKLLRGSPVQRHYAQALDATGSMYLLIDRWKESEGYRRKALAIFEVLGDEAGEARVYAGLATTLLHEHRLAEAEDEARKALEILEKQLRPDPGDTLTALIARSYAECFQGRCVEGLAEASKALDVAQKAFSKNSIEMVAALLAVGFEKWKNGAAAEREKTMREGLESLRQNRDVSQAMLADAQMQVLQTYTDYLKATHQKAQAKQVEAEMTQLREEQPAQCTDCVVNAMALSANAR